MADGAPMYAAARPVALLGAMQRLGIDKLLMVQKMRRQLGGVALFNPAILAAPGKDRPRAFASKEGSGHTLTVWKREKKEKQR